MKKSEWFCYFENGTNYSSSQKVTPFNGQYGYFISDIDECWTEGGFKAIRETINIVENKNLVAKCEVTTFWRTKKSKYTKHEYVVGYDQHDTDLHTLSMWMFDKMLPDNALLETAAINIADLEISPSLDVNIEYYDVAITIAKTIGIEHGGKRIGNILFTFSEDCRSRDKVESIVGNIRSTKSLMGNTENSQFWHTKMIEKPLSSHRDLHYKF